MSHYTLIPTTTIIQDFFFFTHQHSNSQLSVLLSLNLIQTLIYGESGGDNRDFTTSKTLMIMRAKLYIKT